MSNSPSRVEEKEEEELSWYSRVGARLFQDLWN
jgi:hypothetical protein